MSRGRDDGAVGVAVEDGASAVAHEAVERSMEPVVWVRTDNR
jgi:hypothetical protein